MVGGEGGEVDMNTKAWGGLGGGEMGALFNNRQGVGGWGRGGRVSGDEGRSGGTCAVVRGNVICARLVKMTVGFCDNAIHTYLETAAHIATRYCREYRSYPPLSFAAAWPPLKSEVQLSGTV